MNIKTPTLSLILLVSLFAAAAFAQEPGKGKDDKAKPEPQKVEKPAVKAPARTKGEPLEFPDVEGWQKGTTVKYPQRELGYGLNYDADGGSRVSVYVYNNGRKDIKNSLTGAVKEEIENAKAGIDAMVEMGAYSDVKVLKDEKSKLGGKDGKIDVLRKVLSLKAGNTALHTEIILFPFEGDFVKIRASRPKSLGPEAEEAVNKLLAEIEAFFVMYMDIAGAARTAVK